VVYEAVQISLGRRVALKVLPFAAALDSRHLQRFKNEAEAAAHLQHPHIVPVYAVGCERGVHYYAMQLIEGQTLATLIQELRRPGGLQSPSQGGLPSTVAEAVLSTVHSTTDPTFFRTVASLAVQAALALEHAHALGIVHRDVKPANLLLDVQGNLWVTDFGLARVATQAPALTLTGDVVGTLRYMSPEQALAQPSGIDHRTDLYSLAATLYELLTLEPVFNARDRQQLLLQVALEEPKPPRQLNKAIPVELETIVLKAMAKNPQERYASAQELADDLDRFLKDEPILARRPTLAQRCGKWARRHRPAVWAAALTSVLTLAVLAGSVGWVVRDQAARQVRTATEVHAALQEAQRSRREGKWLQAQAAASRAEALLAQGGGSAELRRSVCELLADLRMVLRLEEIRLLQSSVKDGRFDSEGADRRYAAAFRDHGIDVEALPLQEAAQLIAAQTIQVELAAALDGWARMRRYNPRKDRKSWQDLLAVARAGDRDPRRTALRDAVLRRDRQALLEWAASDSVPGLPPVTLGLLAEYLEEMAGLPEATVLLRRAQEQHPSDFWINHQLAFCLGRMGPSQRDEAIRFHTVAVALRPDSPGAYLNLGNALLQKRRLADALVAYRRAIALKPDYAEAHCNAGATLWDMGRHDQGIASLLEAIALKPDLAEAHGNLGFSFWTRGQLDKAIAALRKAVELNPAFVETQNNLGHALLDKGRPGEAVAVLRKAIQLKPDFAQAHDGLGKALTRLGQIDEGIAAFHRAIALKPDYAEAYCNLGVSLDRKGRVDESLTAYRRAIAFAPTLITARFNLGLVLTETGQLDAAVAAFREVIELKPDFPAVHYNLGRALWMKGRIEEAMAAYRRAIELKPDYAEAHCNLGCCLLQQGQFAQALASTRRGHELGSRRRDWPYPSAQWVRQCQRLDKLADRLPAFLRGEAQPAGAAQKSEYAQLCYYKRLYVAAARLWVEAFTAEPKLACDLQAAHRYHAACAAARAGCGKGAHAEKLTDQECRRWRRQALTWLRADLALRRRQLHSAEPKDRAEAQEKLRDWQQDPELIGLRDPAAVAGLPAGERKACEQLWAEVKALLTRAGAAR
jgi:tetratricopeptide (TPR) repeat protein